MITGQTGLLESSRPIQAFELLRHVDLGAKRARRAGKSRQHAGGVLIDRPGQFWSVVNTVASSGSPKNRLRLEKWEEMPNPRERPPQSPLRELCTTAQRVSAAGLRGGFVSLKSRGVSRPNAVNLHQIQTDHHMQHQNVSMYMRVRVMVVRHSSPGF